MNETGPRIRDRRMLCMWVVAFTVVFLTGFIAGDRYPLSRKTLVKNEVEQTITNLPLKPQEIFVSQSRSSPNLGFPPSPVPTGAEETVRKSAEERKAASVESHLRDEAEKRDATYGQVLAELGLDSEQVRRVTEKLTQVHRNAVKAGDALVPLIQSRYRYDKEMKSLLGDEAYQEYREFEAGKPFRREVDSLLTFSDAHHGKIDPSYIGELATVFQKFNLQTAESWDGPYDPLPSPLAGAEPIIAKHRSTISSINEGFAALQQAPEWGALPAEVQNLVSSYFSQKVSELDGLTQHLSVDREQRRRIEMERLAKSLSERVRERQLPPSLPAR